MTRYVGVSNFVGWQTAQAATWQKACAGSGTADEPAGGVLAAGPAGRAGAGAGGRSLRARAVPLVAAGPWGADRAVPHPHPRGSRAARTHFAWFVQPYLEQRSKGVVEAVAMAADGLDLTPLQVALLWVRDAPGVTAPLLGARTAGQLAPALATETLTLPAEIISRPGRRLRRSAPRSTAAPRRRRQLSRRRIDGNPWQLRGCCGTRDRGLRRSAGRG